MAVHNNNKVPALKATKQKQRFWLKIARVQVENEIFTLLVTLESFAASVE